CAGNWTANTSFQPTAGLVFFNGSGVQTVLMPVFQWFDLRIGATSTVNTAQSAATLGLLDVLGHLTCGGSSVQVGGALTVAAAGVLTAGRASTLSCGGTAVISGTLAAGSAALTANDFTVQSGAAVTLGNGTHTLNGSFVQHGSLTLPGTALVQFLGSGNVDAAAAFPLPPVAFGGGNHTVSGRAAAAPLTH